MAKKASIKKPAKKIDNAMTAGDHHRLADMHNAKGNIHRAKAQLLEAQNPPKKSTANKWPRGS